MFPRLASSLALIAALSACGASRQYFRPAERAVAESPDGFAAAEYRLQLDNERWGEVRVWSAGAEEREVDGKDATVLHVGFAIKNVTDGPLELDLDSLRVEAIRSESPPPPALAPRHESGVLRAEAHAVREVNLEFDLPAEFEPEDLFAFQVHWTLRGPREMAYEQFTPFSCYRPYYRDYWYDDHYWSHPWWGFHYGSRWCW